MNSTKSRPTGSLSEIIKQLECGYRISTNSTVPLIYCCLFEKMRGSVSSMRHSARFCVQPTADSHLGTSLGFFGLTWFKGWNHCSIEPRVGADIALQQPQIPHSIDWYWNTIEWLGSVETVHHFHHQLIPVMTTWLEHNSPKTQCRPVVGPLKRHGGRV